MKPVNRAKRSQSTGSGYLSSSVGHRNPTRSFYHYASHTQPEPLQYSSLGVREQTQELANWALGDSSSYKGSGLQHQQEASASGSDVGGHDRSNSVFSDSDAGDPRDSLDSTHPDAIEEVSEPQSPEDNEHEIVKKGPDQPSALSNLIREADPDHRYDYLTIGSNGRELDSDRRSEISVMIDDYDTGESTEVSALLPRARLPPSRKLQKYNYTEPGFAEQQKTIVGKRWSWFKFAAKDALNRVASPRTWNVVQMWEVSVGAVSAVFLGLLLNILDALSYGEFCEEVSVLTG